MHWSELRHETSRKLDRVLNTQLSRMAREIGKSLQAPPLSRIRDRAFESLEVIDALLHDGAIRPDTPIRLSKNAAPVEPSDHTVRLGVYPINGNPIHWGHLLCALSTVATHRLDRVAVVIQGIDRRKRQMSTATEEHRHRMANRLLSGFEPLLGYSDVGRGRVSTGEMNVFRLFHLNPKQPIHAFYIVGGDHFSEFDEQGNPDTLARLERNIDDPGIWYDSNVHSLTVLFVEREEPLDAQEAPTDLSTDVVPQILDASSTEVRDGRIALTPHENLQYIRNNPEYSKQIGLHKTDLSEPNGS